MTPEEVVIETGPPSELCLGPVSLAHRASVTASVQEVAAFPAGVTNGQTVAR